MSTTVIDIESARRRVTGQGPTPQPVVKPRKKPVVRENQWFRPRIVNAWARKRITIDRIAFREQILPSQVEAILQEELGPYVPPAIAMRRAV